MIREGHEFGSSFHESADAVIIGSGCGGGAVAKTLAESGLRVVVLEEGGYYTPDQFQATEEFAYQHLYRRRGAQSTEDLAVTVLQGRCVGGSSTINWLTSLRTPEFVLEAWRARHGVTGMTLREMEPYFNRVEKYLNVRPEPEGNHSPNNRIILDGAARLGWRARANGRNARDCVGAGACGLGCPFDAKRSVDRTYIPDAVKAGAALLADCRADSIETRSSVKRVRGTVLDRGTRRERFPFTVDAGVVVVSAGAIHTPVILRKSDLPDRSGQLGKNLTFHLTTAVLGVYDRVIYPAGGRPQSAYCDEFLNRNGDEGGFWIESVPVHPALAAMALPGFGLEHRAMMRQFPNLGATIALVKETDSAGSVRVNDAGRPAIFYAIGPKDLAYLKEAVAAMCRLQLAAGAKSVRTLHARKTEFRMPEEIDRGLRNASWGLNEIALFSAHPLGSCRMGSDPARSVVDSNGQMHGATGIFVVDGSVIPTSLGVNPQLTILAIAEKNAEWIAANFRSLA